MPDPLLVDQRVAGDAAGDRDAEQEPDAVRVREAADEQDPEDDESDAGRLPRAGRVPEHGDGDEEHEDRRSAARDRVDDGERRPAVRRGEEREVRELEQPAADEPRPRRRLDVPLDDGDGREHELRREQRDDCGRLDVRRTGEQQVPQRVEHRRRERERECSCRHVPTLSSPPDEGAGLRLQRDDFGRRARPHPRVSGAVRRGRPADHGRRVPQRARGPHRPRDVHALARLRRPGPDGGADPPLPGARRGWVDRRRGDPRGRPLRGGTRPGRARDERLQGRGRPGARRDRPARGVHRRRLAGRRHERQATSGAVPPHRRAARRPGRSS